jgi:hypothetical protein
MTDQTPELSLPYLFASQADKHVTVNAAFDRIDAIAQLKVKSASILIEPTQPNEGDQYILPAGKTGPSWSGLQSGHIARWVAGGWMIMVPKEGWQAWVEDNQTLLMFSGANWSATMLRKGLGLGDTSAPTFNGLKLSSSASFFPQAVNMNTANDAYGSYQILRKARNTNLPCQQGDFLGTLMFQGTGTDGQAASSAWLQASTIAVAGPTYNPSRLDFFVTDNAGVVRNRLGIAEQIEINGHLLPKQDAQFNLGSASARLGTIYAATGVINTSDARDKSSLDKIPDGVTRAINDILRDVGVYQWRSSMAEKGPDKARLHIGVTAQSVQAAFRAHGENPNRWGLFCEDATQPPAGEAAKTKKKRLGLRHDQLFWLALAVLAQR